MQAIQAIETVDTARAWDVISGDIQIDQKELEVEEECLHILALYQPVASNMRFIIAVLTINKDLERIGDLSVNLAEQVMFLSEEPGPQRVPSRLSEQCENVLAMVRDSLDALVNADGQLARQVIEADDAVDQAHRELCERIKKRIRETPQESGSLIDLLLASRQLERIADHAVNIAEDVVYMVEGEVVRHHLTVEHRRDSV